MQIVSQLSLESEVHLHPENNPTQDAGLVVASSTLNNAVLQQSAKRQWAAWTRQEEESFFTALRQVGKNFEKITHKVQSKNKDQVRHYYYRLVRRMNKLLGPGLCLDAKNSKDTNAAMLRWWSLLEKYSCKASKLHLKPRRFKIFVEALEHQLLKDRRRSVKRRSSQGENCSPTASSNVSSQNRPSGQDTCTVKLVLVDSQNIQKLGPAKGSFKRNVNIGVNRSSKGEMTTLKPARQQRKPGTAFSAAYKKWEKAAIAGVSLVADAAEHLERTATDKDGELDQGPNALGSVDKVPLPLPAISQNLFIENITHTSVKLKLQLYPIDDGTRRALEMDNHNPHLELTLSTRKKISSVVEHLSRKWGNSSVASGQLMLFPYSVQRENLVGYQRWTQDSVVSAADVYAIIGSPPLFRLRYGWFSGSELVQALSASCYIPVVYNENVKNGKDQSMPSTSDQSEKLVDPCNGTSVNENLVIASSLSDMPHEMSRCISTSKSNFVESDPAVKISWHREPDGKPISRQLEDEGNVKLSNGTALSAGEWADSLTNISVGDLLSEVPHGVDASPETPQCLQQIPFSSDSFDAAIAAHISKHQNRMEHVSTLTSHTTSIWDAEETRDAFSFQKNPTIYQEAFRMPDIDPAVDCILFTKISSMGSGGLIEELPADKAAVEYIAGEDPMDEKPTDFHILENMEKDFSGLTDMFWPDSLGPLELDIPSSKYPCEDLILGDSLGGLNRLIASSLDAFQNCSFFGLDKKELTTTVETRETATLSDFKVGSQG
ncbi:TSL-kinase interacting protein 1 isoform X2 [Mangifera indica]|uniref:TSL-kinase interacting protein 1 isoform X2 n=1 Tax=Mangifera indica TaxID=29780 RepID=UPI001CFB8DA5|nr:TSL-kinase interacting protein 1 isoform X2 [Mangifera indica]